MMASVSEDEQGTVTSSTNCTLPDNEGKERLV